MESGRIELKKLCEPQLQFSMDMANIYALDEFEPIINQFQLGNIIKVGIRSDYIKQSRLLEANINFEDFSDFSCEFGELTSLRTQSDIHADLLGQAISAGKSVATNSSYWTQGSDQATATDLRIQQGLLDATTQIKAIDGTQGVVIDKYGIRLQKQNDDGSIDPHQTWIVNNMMLMTDDGWETSRTGIGQFTIDGKEFYGLIAEAVFAGYIEGSRIYSSDMEGGTIRIGLQEDGSYAFEVHEDGSVTMGGGSSIDGYVKEEDFNDIKGKVEGIESTTNANMYRVEIVADGPTVISTSEDKITLTCRVYSWDADITETIDASYFNWYRISPDETLDENVMTDEQWSQMPAHQQTKSIIIDADDVVYNSSFYCEVEFPDQEKEEQDGSQSI